MAKTDLKHYKRNQDKYPGIYRGVVEDNNDPMQMGRCRIRVWGVHSENKTDMPTDRLPWSDPALGLVEGGMSGFGMFSVPLQGSHVFLFFEGENWQRPVYFATAPGLPAQKPSSAIGFSDPSGEQPEITGAPDYHCLTRGATDKLPQTQAELANLAPVSVGDVETKVETRQRTYRENIVFSTHGGIVVEVDNSSPRFLVYHPSGSRIEVDVNGNMDLVASGSGGNMTQVSANDHGLGVAGDQTTAVGGNMSMTIAGDMSISVGGKLDIVTGTETNMTSGANTTIKGLTIQLNPGD